LDGGDEFILDVHCHLPGNQFLGKEKPEISGFRCISADIGGRRSIAYFLLRTTNA